MSNSFKKLANHLSREEKLKYISEDLSEEERNALADKLTVLAVEYIDALRSHRRELTGETIENKKKADLMTEDLLNETLKQIKTK